MRQSRGPWGDYGLTDERYLGYSATDSVSSMQGITTSVPFSTSNDQLPTPHHQEEQEQEQQQQQQYPTTTRSLNTVGAVEAHPPSSHRPNWAVANDIFWERYGSVGPSDGRTWLPLPHLSILSGQRSRTGDGDSRHNITSMEPLLWRNTRQSVVNGEEFGLFGPQEPWLTLPLHPIQARGVYKQGESPVVDASVQSIASQQALQRPVLFQYKPYEHQEPLNLTDAETEAVLEAAFGRSGSRTQGMNVAGDVAPVILIKLIMDLYLRVGPAASFTRVISMLEPPLIHGDDDARERVFDLVTNLLLHGDLLFQGEDESCKQGADGAVDARSGLKIAPGDTEHQAALGTLTTWPPLPADDPTLAMLSEVSLAALRQAHFNQWLRLVLFHVMDLCRKNSTSTIIGTWTTSAVACLAMMCNYKGLPVRGYLDGLSLSVVAFLLEQSRKRAWPTQIKCWLGSIAADLLYTTSGDGGGDGKGKGKGGARGLDRFVERSPFLKWEETTNEITTPNGLKGHQTNRLALGIVRVDGQRLEAFGGPLAVAKNYVLAPTLQCKRVFFCIMFDIVTGRIHWPGDQAGDSDISWTLPQGRMAHPSEVTALGAALIHTRAAEALWCLLPLASNRFGDLAPVVEELRSQMAAVHARHPELGVITSAPPAFVADCLSQLALMAGGGIVEKEVTLSTVEEEIRKFCASPPHSEDSEFMLSLKLARLLVERADGRVIESRGSGMGVVANEQVLLPEENALTDVLTHALTQPSGCFASPFAVSVCHALHALRLRFAGIVGPSAWVNVRCQSFVQNGVVDIDGEQCDYQTTCLSIAEHTISRAAQWIVSLAPPTPSRTLAILHLSEALVSAMTVRHEDSHCGCCSVPVFENDSTITDRGRNHHHALDSGGGGGLDGLAQTTAVEGVISPVSRENKLPLQVRDPLLSIQLDQQRSSAHSSAPSSAHSPAPSSVDSPAHSRSHSLTYSHLKPQAQGQAQVQQAQQRAKVEVQSFGPLSSGLASLSQQGRREEGDIVNGGGTSSSVEPRPSAVGGRPLAAAWRRITRSGNESQQQPLLIAQQHQVLQGQAGLGKEDVKLDPSTEPTVASPLPGTPPPNTFTFQPPFAPTPFSLRNMAARKAKEERRAVELTTAKTLVTLETLEEKITPVESLLAGLALLPTISINLLTLESLRLMFDTLDIHSLRFCTAGSEQNVVRSSAAVLRNPLGQPSRSKQMTTAAPVAAARPLLDIRASIAVLLLKKADTTDHVSSSSPISPSFLELLLADPDPRIRRHTAVFALRRFSSMSDGEPYHAALREVIGKAQRTDSDRTILLPEAQVTAFLEVRALRLDELFESST